MLRGRFRRGLVCLALSVVAARAGAEPQSTAPRLSEANMLLLAVMADGQFLSDAIPAFRSGPRVLLPLGELARTLTIAVTSQPEKGIASGFVVSEARDFLLNVPRGTVTRSGISEPLEAGAIEVREDDVYVDSSLIARWLPVDMDIDFSGLVLKLSLREKLPFQMRRERERAGEQISWRGKRDDLDYPRQDMPYRVFDAPFIDQTVSANLGGQANGSHKPTYVTYLTADLMGMESSLYLTNSAAQEKQRIRYTIGRHDPDAELLGPLGARSVGFGNVPIPAVENVSRGSFFGTGMMLSNRLLTRPTSFDRHSLQGDLPPGWDVELFYNNMLIATQQSRADGKYNFDDQPLMYGPNEFRLVFHGPLGQTRVERQSFTLDQSVSRPGDFYYDFSQHQDLAGMRHTSAQFDAGLMRGLSATGGVVSMPLGGAEQRYTNVGLRAFWESFIVNAYCVAAQGGGSLAQAELKTRVGDFGVDLSHTTLSSFASDYFTDSLRRREKLRLSGPLDLLVLPSLPLTLEILRDSYVEGDKVVQGNASVSAYQFGTWITNRLSWASYGEAKSVSGSLLLGRRVADVGLNAQIGYSVKPASELTDVAVFANKTISDGYTAIASLSHSLSSGDTQYTAALNKGIGHFGFGLTASYSSRGSVSIGVQFFMSLAKEPRKSSWSFDAIPKANMGAASVRTFVDANMNGVMDEGEAPIKGAGFKINGGGLLPQRTDSSGVAMFGNLPPFEKTDIGLEVETLEEPEWMPLNKGARIVPRPGRVMELDFPVVLASEIDGTVYLMQDGARKGIGGVIIELLDGEKKVVSSIRTSWDGYYVLSGVRPGSYLLRISPEQVERQRLVEVPVRSIVIGGDGKFVDGMDFVISRDTPGVRSKPGVAAH
jgi:hypothetical protein